MSEGHRRILPAPTGAFGSPDRRLGRPWLLLPVSIVSAAAVAILVPALAERAVGLGGLAVLAWIAAFSFAARGQGKSGSAQGSELAARHAERFSLENQIDAVVLRFNASGELVAASAKANPILGLPPESLLGAGLFERVHVADRVGYLRALDAMRAGAEGQRLELRLRLPRQNGSGTGFRPFAIEFCKTSVAAEWTVILRDNAAVDDLRNELRAAAETAAHCEAANHALIASVSHELRTPLNAILGFSDMLLHDIGGNFTHARRNEYVGLIRQSGEHLLTVVNSTLDLSRLEAQRSELHREAFRFCDAVEMCRAMIAPGAEKKGLTLVIRAARSVGEIHADRQAVQQILINLVANAVKFTPAGGRVTVGASRIGSQLHLWVSDTGIGISEADLPRLGEPFVQVGSNAALGCEGSGLGLSLVKGLVARHGGVLSIESALGEGTTVRISLPVDAPVAREMPGAIAIVPVQQSREVTHGAFRKAG